MEGDDFKLKKLEKVIWKEYEKSDSWPVDMSLKDWLLEAAGRQDIVGVAKIVCQVGTRFSNFLANIYVPLKALDA